MRATSERLPDERDVVVHGEHDDPGSWRLSEQHRQVLQRVVSAKAEVEHDKIRVQIVHRDEQLTDRGRLTDHLTALIGGEQRP